MSRHVPAVDLGAVGNELRERVARPRGCGNKLRYTGRKQALGAIGVLRKADPDDPRAEELVAYKCPHGCHGWHIGHDRYLTP